MREWKERRASGNYSSTDLTVHFFHQNTLRFVHLCSQHYHNSQETEATEMSTDGWINEMWHFVVNTMEYYSVLKGKAIRTCYNMSES